MRSLLARVIAAWRQVMESSRFPLSFPFVRNEPGPGRHAGMRLFPAAPLGLVRAISARWRTWGTVSKRRADADGSTRSPLTFNDESGGGEWRGRRLQTWIIKPGGNYNHFPSMPPTIRVTAARRPPVGKGKPRPQAAVRQRGTKRGHRKVWM